MHSTRDLYSQVTAGLSAINQFITRKAANKQEAQLPQRDSASPTHVLLGSLTDRALH